MVLRFSSIGDIVLSSPVVRCLKRQINAEVHFLTKRQYEPILNPNPYIDRVFSFQKRVREVLPALKKEQYDWVIDLHHNLRSQRVKLSLYRPSRSFDKLNFEKWLLVNFKLNWLPGQSIVHRYMDTLGHLGVEYDGQGLDFFIPQDQEVNPAQLSPGLVPEGYVAFVIGATHATKRLPAAKIIEICRQLQTPVVLLGGSAEAEAGRRIASTAGAHVINLCGVLSLHQSASVVKQAAKVATHDTGLMHIAAALRKDIVSIWGNTVPEFGMYPFYPDGMNRSTIIEMQDLPCRPCSKIGYKRCPKKHFRCMNALDIVQICSALAPGPAW